MCSSVNLSVFGFYQLTRLDQKQDGDHIGDYYFNAFSSIKFNKYRKIVDHSDVVGASPVGAAPSTFSFAT